ncbi:NAD(+)/NADH kinase [Serpentinicella sp. ANB-PHB4]|uniref:NAD(+)/NADH kinase n=1 Tax=Serpentinicella sp. ANB-PHB4 TaxID=3074076 RepID=UPI00285C15EF|nr:NAD(+)/NADH kinase [Serpentinicella sp. ANB-PHB4]MDR5658337.1 NAD(+)/NADH kinase [Serpentinicella sp. ANB-PHB4]
MTKKGLINIIYNNTNFSINTAKYLKDRLMGFGYQVSDHFDFNAELVICIGGDGSFLRALHQHGFPSIPIVGINTGHLGFFTEINPNEIDDFLEKYITQQYTISTINPVQADICTRNDCIEALGINEIAIKGDKSRTIHLNISVDEHLIQRFSGDGILVSSSTGSTAYNYSIGGSLIDPRLSALQVTPLAPINTNAYRCFTSSVILPSDAVIKVHPEYHFEDSIVIVSDGLEHRYFGINEISLKMSELEINLLKLEGSSFWSKAIEKFL